MISLHLPGVCPFGITPVRLMCTPGITPCGKGLHILPSATSPATYRCVTSGCARAVASCRPQSVGVVEPQTKTLLDALQGKYPIKMCVEAVLSLDQVPCQRHVDICQLGQVAWHLLWSCTVQHTEVSCIGGGRQQSFAVP